MIRTDSHEMNERVEMIVDVYESIDSAREHNIRTDTNTHQLQRTGSDCVKNRRQRSVVVCLVVLCVLLLTAVIVLCFLNYTNHHQFNNIKNITEERDQLLTKIQELNKQRKRINQEKHDLLKCIDEKGGWKHFHLSCYYISSVEKSWSESRRYCQNKGADLIIINNKQEQEFVKQISSTERYWIGLSDSDVEGRWKWVDGSTLTSSFRRSGEPNGHRSENCAVSYSSWWYDYPCFRAFKWICEKNLSL